MVLSVSKCFPFNNRKKSVPCERQRNRLLYYVDHFGEIRKVTVLIVSAPLGVESNPFAESLLCEVGCVLYQPCYGVRTNKQRQDATSLMLA